MQLVSRIEKVHGFARIFWQGRKVAGDSGKRKPAGLPPPDNAYLPLLERKASEKIGSYDIS